MSGFTMTIDDTPRGTCRICGKAAYAPQAKVCQEHRTQRAGAPRTDRMADIDKAIARETGTEPPKSDVKETPPSTAGGFQPPSLTTTPDKAERAAHFARQIEQELNPALAQGFAFICRPVPPVNFYRTEGDRIVPQGLGETVALSGLETWVISHAAAELEGHPMVKTAGTVAGPILPFALAAGAAVLIGAKLYGVYTLREQVLEKWKLETGAAAGQEAHAAANAAAQEGEAQRQAQAGSVRAEQEAQAARSAAQEQERVDNAPVNRTRAEPLTDIDLGTPGAPAVDSADLPDLGAESDAMLADLFAQTA